MGIVAAVLLFASGHCLFGLGNQAFAYGGYGDYGGYPYGGSYGDYGGYPYGGYYDPWSPPPYVYCSYADYKSNVAWYGDCYPFGYY